MSQRKRRILLSAYVAAAFLVLCSFAWRGEMQARTERRGREYGYERALAELADNVGDMDAGLQKALCAASPGLFSSCCAEVYAKSLAAQAAVSQLPGRGETLSDTASFLAKTGAYALSLARRAADGEMPGEGDYENLARLRETAKSLSDSLVALSAAVRSGEIPFTSESVDAEAEASDVPGSLADVESRFPEIPVLIYDGPFSDGESGGGGVLDREAEATEEVARAAAAAWCGDEAVLTGTRDCEIPVYVFSGAAGGDACLCEVTRRGAHVIAYRRQETPLERNLDPERAAELAAEYLSDRGYDSMTASYRQIEGESLTVVFHYEKDDVIYYPDLIKVTVSLDTGEVLGFDASEYLRNHASRDLPDPVIPEADALAAVSPWLRAERQHLAVIPAPNGRELFCREVVCTGGDGGHYLIYVNALTGAEERILILLEDENGTLTR